MPVKMKQPGQQQLAVPQAEQTLVHEPKQAVLSETQLMVDEFVMCSEEIKPLKPMIKMVEEHRKKLQALAMTIDPTGKQPVTIEGSNGRTVTFKPAGESRKIVDMNGLIGAIKEKISYEDLMQLVSISLTEMDKILSPLEQAAFVEKVQSSRVLDGYATGE